MEKEMEYIKVYYKFSYANINIIYAHSINEWKAHSPSPGCIQLRHYKQFRRSKTSNMLNEVIIHREI